MPSKPPGGTSVCLHRRGFGDKIFGCRKQLVVKIPVCQGIRCRKTQVQAPGQEDALEEGMATHSSVLAWRIPGTEEPGGLQSMGSQRVRHD